MKSTLIEYVGKLKCRSCGKEYEFCSADPADRVSCNHCNSRRVTTFQREDIEQILIYLESSIPRYSVTVHLLLDHHKKEIIPGRMGAVFRNVNSPKVEKDIIEFLRNNSHEITNKDFWRGYRFIEDFSRISG